MLVKIVIRRKLLMTKKIIYLLAGLILVFQYTGCSFAKSANNTITPVQIAIKKYKKGNYTGCLQDCMKIIEKKPSDVAYYYMAMSYVQAGNKEEALKAYTNALNISKNTQLQEYANTGKRCLESPDKCQLETGEASSDLDKFISSPYVNISDSVKKGIQQKKLDAIKDQINSGQDIDDYHLNKINYQNNKPNIALNNQKPSNDEILAALEILSAAGLNPYQSLDNTVLLHENTQNAAAAQINQLMGVDQASKNNNSMLDILPFMPVQDRTGGNNYSPQVLQALIMNSMMSDVNFGLNNKNN